MNKVMSKTDYTKQANTSANLLETIVEKVENYGQNVHPSTLDYITKLSQDLTMQLGADFVEEKRMSISQQFAQHVLNNKSAWSQFFSMMGLGKIKINTSKLDEIMANYISQNKQDSRIYDYEKNILPKIKNNKITKDHFILGLQNFGKIYAKKLPKNYQKRLLSLDLKNVGKLTKSELSALRNINPQLFDDLALTLPNSKQSKKQFNIPIQTRRAKSKMATAEL